MYERFTEQARRVLFFARYETSNYGSPQIESEHLLLGLLRESKFILDPPRASLNAPEIIRRRIHQSAAQGAKSITPFDPPVSSECQRILASAAEEASAFGHLFIGTEHILAGILREEESFASLLLREHGARLEPIREGLRHSLTGDASQRPVSPELLYTPEGRDALQFAREEAKALGSRNIGTEHLIVGVLRANVFAAQLLAQRGLTIDILREDIARRDVGPTR